MSVTVQAEDPTHPDAARLIGELSAELGARYGDLGGGAFSPADVQVPRAVFLIARLDGDPVGCGALRPLPVTDAPPDANIAEIKRMYVQPGHRGRRIAGQILTALEAHARAFAYAAIWLETGTLQPEAIRLYERTGYTRRPCYGSYERSPLSVCYAKTL